MHPHNLPSQPTSFVGRRRALTEITSLLADPACRVLTLVGPGGSGKTRLAIEAARHMAFANGVYFVAFQPLRASENISTAIVEALPLPASSSEDPEQLLLHYLQDKQMLLILDNFEHLLDGADLVTRLHEAAERVKLLITSRERLNLRIEQVWPVPGLDVPDNRQPDPIRRSAARLFVERARLVQPDFAWEDQADAMARICRLVQGLPLALELAAAWVRVMPCAAIADEIQANMDLLATNQRDMPIRHRSMRAVFDHSWSLLTPQEQIAFSKLPVFRGGFTPDAAEKVAGATLPVLAALIDKSLVQVGVNGRYDLHELVRQYAGEQLEAAGETAATTAAHGAYFAGFMHARRAKLVTLHEPNTLNEIAQEFENIRAAWLALVEQRQMDLLDQALITLCVFCDYQGRYRDGIALLEKARVALADHVDTGDSPLWGRLLSRLYSLEKQVVPSPQRVVKYPQYRAEVQTALKIARRHNDRWETAFCLNELSTIEDFQGHMNEVASLLDESLRLFAELDDTDFVSRVMQGQVCYFTMVGQGERAHQLARELVDYSRTRVGMTRFIEALCLYGWSALHFKGDFESARRAYDEALRLGANVLHGRRLYLIWFHTGLMAIFSGDFEQALAIGEQARAAGQEFNHHDALGFSSVLFGLKCGLEGDYTQALAHGREARPHLVRPYQRFFVDLTLVIAACGLEDDATVLKLLVPMLELADLTQRVIWIMACLPCAAVLLARSGQAERAVELLGLAWTQPKSWSSWLGRWTFLSQVRAELETALGPRAFEAAWARGTRRDLARAIHELLADLRPDTPRAFLAGPPHPATSALIEPLTPRELEVLQLIVAGLDNRGIAEELVVATRTVKKHINHIFGKLAVSHRGEAIARARELALVE
jgi:predicted ATPase/DNA-binding CsgD family transcriptional regulator